MFKTIIFTFLFSLSLFGEVIPVDNIQLKQMIDNGIVVIDIRRYDEWKKYGIIDGSKTLTFFDINGNYDAVSWLNSFTSYIGDKNTPVVIYCAHANRTKVVGNFLNKQLGYNYVYELKGGINYGWIDKGMSIVKY